MVALQPSLFAPRGEEQTEMAVFAGQRHLSLNLSFILLYTICLTLGLTCICCMYLIRFA